MLFGMAAASSAIDLVKSLTQGNAASKPKTTACAPQSDASSTSASPGSGASGTAGAISPDTMNALFAAQSQTESAGSTNRSAALKNLFKTLDADGSGSISKSEFEDALGAGGTNTTNADSVFGQLDANGDGNVSLSELAAALKPKKHAHGPKPASEKDALLQALDNANATANADGIKVTSSPIALSDAARSYNAVTRMTPQLADMLTKNTTSSLSVSV